MEEMDRKTNKDKKVERFRKVAVGRTNKIIDTLQLLGNCANKSNYEYTDEEVKKIFNAIERELRDTKAKFAEASKKNERFTL